MSSKARRVAETARIDPFPWHTTLRDPVAPPPASPPAPEQPAAPAPETPPAEPEVDRRVQISMIERDAFAKGYAQGERTGAEAAAVRGEAMLRRLAETLKELTTLRAEMIRRTEGQVTQLALAIAKRVVLREVSMDRGLLAAMARVALDRLGEQARATIRLHPDDYTAVMAGRETLDASGQVQVVADPLVSLGGCLVHSNFGFMDVSPHAQFDELARTLLEDAEAVPVPASGHAADEFARF